MNHDQEKEVCNVVIEEDVVKDEVEIQAEEKEPEIIPLDPFTPNQESSVLDRGGGKQRFERS